MLNLLFLNVNAQRCDVFCGSTLRSAQSIVIAICWLSPDARPLIFAQELRSLIHFPRLCQMLAGNGPPVCV